MMRSNASRSRSTRRWAASTSSSTTPAPTPTAPGGRRHQLTGSLSTTPCSSGSLRRVVELVGGDDLPVIAAAGVDAVIRRDDTLKEQILRPMFGDEWPQQRMFPNRP